MTENTTPANAGRVDSADASSPTRPNNTYHPPWPRLSNHSDANIVTTSASNETEASVLAVGAGLTVTPVTRCAVHPAAANQTATGSQASSSRPSVIPGRGDRTAHIPA